MGKFIQTKVYQVINLDYPKIIIIPGGGDIFFLT